MPNEAKNSDYPDACGRSVQIDRSDTENFRSRCFHAGHSFRIVQQHNPICNCMDSASLRARAKRALLHSHHIDYIRLRTAHSPRMTNSQLADEMTAFYPDLERLSAWTVGRARKAMGLHYLPMCDSERREDTAISLRPGRGRIESVQK